VKSYVPLIALVLISILAALAIDLRSSAPSLHLGGMHYFMGFFLCQFAMLKLFDIEGFAEGFAKYDLLGEKFRVYGFVYPFIELFLGLFYLGFLFPFVTYITTIVVTIVSAIGVVRALKRGLNVKCACMGTLLNVPLSTVTLLEDLVMGGMAIFMLVARIF
jgi:hypothetical protein